MNPVDQHAVIEEEQVRGEDQCVLLAGLALGRDLDAQDLVACRLESVGDALDFRRFALERSVAEIEPELVRAAEHGLADRDSRRRRAAQEDEVRLLLPRRDLAQRPPRFHLVEVARAGLTPVERVDEPRILDDAHELPGDGLQGLDLVGRIGAALARLDDDGPDGAVPHRHGTPRNEANCSSLVSGKYRYPGCEDASSTLSERISLTTVPVSPSPSASVTFPSAALSSPWVAMSRSR
jgi:hypothetical protein